MPVAEKAVRSPSILDFPDARSRGEARWFARGRNFTVDYVCGPTGTEIDVNLGAESFALLPDAGAVLTGEGRQLSVDENSVVILPAGRWHFSLRGLGQVAVLSTANEKDPSQAINAAAFLSPDEEVVAVGKAWRRKRALTEPQVFHMTSLEAPKDNPRLKMLQTETMSINWVDYHGVRDRTALSPHSHADFEQGSLALAGEFTHHLRVEWGRNADLWQDDRHATVGTPSLLVVPVRLIHTTEGVGGGRHLLVDIFAPARNDFIAKGWMLNAQDFEHV